MRWASRIGDPDTETVTQDLPKQWDEENDLSDITSGGGYDHSKVLALLDAARGGKCVTMARYCQWQGPGLMLENP